ncbi:MAG: autotransporter outer membrane beta-barrel domain-containing protein [Acidimicrobiales bacterium]
MFTQSAKIAAAIAIVASSVIVSVNMVTATTTASPTSYGYDISFPQCGGNLPTGVGFGIVGVNYGHPFSTNPCLTTQLQWGQSTLSGQTNFYTNTDNPGPANTSHWPNNQQAPKICFGANTAVCAYDYGWNAAQQSFASAVSAESAVGSQSPTSAATTAHWWLDVETGNAWQSIETNYGPSATSFANDQAEIQGELAYFASVGVTWVGIYATGLQWRTIMGPNTGTAFATIPAWMPGYATIAAAQAACVGPSFIGGRVAMIQYPLNGLDGDYICGLLSTPVTATVSVTASSTFTNQLSVFADPVPVSYVQTAGSPSLLVSSTGLVSTSGALSAGTYVASGTTSDTAGNSGTFSFTLLVGIITQIPPTTASTPIASSGTYTGQLLVSGSDGTTTFTKTRGSASLLVSPTGLVSTIGTLPAGRYALAGTTLDTSGDNGTFSFVLTVGTITQSGATFAALTSDKTPSFSHQLAVTGASPPVTFVQTAGAPSLLVSSTGLVTTSGFLGAGSYVVRGTTSDATGDRGKFFFNVRVSSSSTSSTTTTVPVTGATTTTTVPTIVLPVAYRVVGHAVAGATVPLTITGLGFYGRPRVTSHAGTTVVVTRDTGTSLTLKVSVRPRSRNGVFTFTIALSNGTFCKVRYVQRPGTVAR